MGNPRGSLSTRSFRLLSQLSNPSQVSSSAGRSAAASSSSSLETSGAPGTAAAAGTPTRRPQAGSRTGSGPVVDAVSPRRLLLGEPRPVVKRRAVVATHLGRFFSATTHGLRHATRGEPRVRASCETSLSPVGYSKSNSKSNKKLLLCSGSGKIAGAPRRLVFASVLQAASSLPGEVRG